MRDRRPASHPRAPRPLDRQPLDWRRLRLPPSLLVVVLASLAVACATSGVNRGDLNLIPLEEEWELGNQLEGELDDRLQLVEDGDARAYLEGMGRKIVAQSELADMPWEFHIVADPQVNAFNVPGGHVYIHTGLAAAADDAAAFAGVLAHEIAHGVARHGTENLTKSYGVSLLASLALGEDPSTRERLLAQILGGGTLAKFSRDAEREADELGLRYMVRAGYDPDGMARIFRTLLEQRRRRPGALAQFFASHPLTEERIAAVERQAAGLADGGNLVSEEPGFERFQQRLSRYNR